MFNLINTVTQTQNLPLLAGADVVVIPAGVPRKPGMTRDDLFNTNASIVRDLAKNIAQNAPKAILAIITNPVNSMVPIASEVLTKVMVNLFIFLVPILIMRISVKVLLPY